MRATKWILWSFLLVVTVLIAGIGVSFAIAPKREPNTLYTAYQAQIKSFDPAVANDTLASGIAGNFFECLYNYKYAVQPYELLPELAAEMPQFSPDGKTITIRLRKGIYFYDPDKAVFPDGKGPEVKAADFVYSWKRVCEYHTASPLYTQVFQGRIEGLDDWWSYSKDTEENQVDWDRPVTGLVAVDDYTLRVVLTDPYPQFKYTLAYSPTAVVCRKVVEHYGRESFARHPVGTGPYGLRSSDYQEDQRIVLHANPYYRGRPDIDGTVQLPQDQKLPYVKRLQLDYFEEAVPVWLLFQQGLFDIAGIPKESYHQAISPTGDLTDEMRAKGIVLDKSIEPATYYVGFNWQDPIVGGAKHKALRQAISMAFDRKNFIHTFLNDRGEPAIGPIPPGFPTFDPTYSNPYTQYDLDAARAKLKEAEQINGGPIPPLALLIGDTDTEARQQGEFFVLQMSKIGLQVNVEYRNWDRFQEMVDNRQTQLFDLGWVADYPDAQDFFQLFYGKNAGPQGANPTAYVNPQFDALYEKAAVMDQSPERDQLYRQMDQIIMEECPWLLEYYPKDFTLYYDWVGKLRPMDYGYGMRQFQTLDAGLRQKRLGHH